MLAVDRLIERKNYVVMLGMVLAVLIAWAGVLDKKSTAYVDQSLVQAAASYGVARLINGAVSVLQSVSVGGSFGVAFDVSPGEALDPINDLVERFAAVMELAIGSLALQKILIVMTSSDIFNWLLTGVVALYWLSSLLKNALTTQPLFRVVLTLIFLRFAIVLAVMANSWVDAAFLEQEVEQQMATVSQASSAVLSAVEEAPEETEESGFFGGIADGVSGLASKTKALASQLNPAALLSSLDGAVSSMIDLMAIFMLKTIMLPLLFLYAVKRAMGALWGVDLSQAKSARAERKLQGAQ